uniref:Mitochondrial peptide chain release factor 2 n=1 Tax=Monodopsis sp. MarTras21 TaxID=1745953 RepID=A0A140ECK6_9STRA|nr:mitochondrial peptide chain release factor 2 [Monodopsis sp. MarTras21]
MRLWRSLRSLPQCGGVNICITRRKGGAGGGWRSRLIAAATNRGGRTISTWHQHNGQYQERISMSPSSFTHQELSTRSSQVASSSSMLQQGASINQNQQRQQQSANKAEAASSSTLHLDEGAARIEKALALVSDKLDLDSKRTKLDQLDGELEDDAVWSKDAVAAGAMAKEAAQLVNQINRVDRIWMEIKHLKEMAHLAKEEGEVEVVEECNDRMAALEKESDKLQIQTLLIQSPADEGDCFLEIQAGAGGRESGDWVEMLLRMYQKFAEKKGFVVDTVQETWGEGGGLRSVMIKISGWLAHGWCRSEAGVHRLVRISPFDSKGSRHTSFAQVRVYPVSSMNGSSAAETILSKDLKIDTYRSQGAGGQHVNTTDSAVRISHLPTGIVVTCQADRSQHRNKAVAMEVLKSKLQQLKEQEAQDEKATYREGLGKNEWGNQIRSYIINPYQMVKDHRTGVELGDVNRVLEQGELEPLIEAALAQKD